MGKLRPEAAQLVGAGTGLDLKYNAVGAPWGLAFLAPSLRIRVGVTQLSVPALRPEFSVLSGPGTGHKEV